MESKKLEYRFRNEIVKFEKEFNVKPNLFKIGAGVYHELEANDCESFYTPVKKWKGDAFVMGIKIEVAEPFNSNNYDISPWQHKERGYTEVFGRYGEIIEIIPNEWGDTEIYSSCTPSEGFYEK